MNRGGFFFISSRSRRGSGFHFRIFRLRELCLPRTISTKTTQGRQLLVYDRQGTLARFKQFNFQDCRISAYPSTKYTRHLKQKPNFLFIDLDFQALDLDKELSQVLTNIKIKLENNTIEPTVLWSGKGYHIYLPINAMTLENESLFEDIEVYDPSRKFLQ